MHCLFRIGIGTELHSIASWSGMGGLVGAQPFVIISQKSYEEDLAVPA